MVDENMWMKLVLPLLFPLFASCVYAGEAAGVSKSLQAIVVTTPGWGSATAQLQAYERGGLHHAWRPVEKLISAVVGRRGLAWGAGLHPAASPESGPVKKEGDGRAPAGIFRLGMAFGYAVPDAVTWIRLPYRQATPDLLCIDDSSSAWYNRIIERGQVKTDWRSHEDMLRHDDLYRLGIVVDHNTDPVVPGAGSCIFLHIWAGSGSGTAGCTAMAEEDLTILLRWLDPRANPVLVQLPEAAYTALEQKWGLPSRKSP